MEKENALLNKKLDFVIHSILDIRQESAVKNLEKTIDNPKKFIREGIDKVMYTLGGIFVGIYITQRNWISLLLLGIVILIPNVHFLYKANKLREQFWGDYKYIKNCEKETQEKVNKVRKELNELIN